jgi:arylsulfatase
MTPFRSEKNTNWEGAFRVPCMVRWPKHIEAGAVTNELMSHLDWLPTLCAVAGDADIPNKCLKGYTFNVKTYKVHIDGFNQLPFLTTVKGSAAKNNGVKSARNIFFYADDDGHVIGIRKGPMKYIYSEQRLEGTMGVWAEPFTHLRMQKIFNLMQDPFERADITSNTYWDWNLNEIGAVYGVTQDVIAFAESLMEYPPRSFPPSFVPANIIEEVMTAVKLKRKIDNYKRMMPQTE